MDPGRRQRRFQNQAGLGRIVLRSLARIAPPLVAVSSLAASGRTLVLDAVYRDELGLTVDYLLKLSVAKTKNT